MKENNVVRLSAIIGLTSTQIGDLATHQRCVERALATRDAAMAAYDRAVAERDAYLSKLGIVEQPAPAPLVPAEPVRWATPAPQAVGYPAEPMPAPSALEKGKADVPTITELPAAPEGTWVELEQNPPAVVEVVEAPSPDVAQEAADSEWISTVDAAAHLGVTRQKIVNGVLWNKFRWRKANGRTEVILSEAREWLEALEAPPIELETCPLKVSARLFDNVIDGQAGMVFPFGGSHYMQVAPAALTGRLPEAMRVQPEDVWRKANPNLEPGPTDWEALETGMLVTDTENEPWVIMANTRYQVQDITAEVGALEAAA